MGVFFVQYKFSTYLLRVFFFYGIEMLVIFDGGCYSWGEILSAENIYLVANSALLPPPPHPHPLPPPPLHHRSREAHNGDRERGGAAEREGEEDSEAPHHLL